MQWDAKAKPPELEGLVIIVDENYPRNQGKIKETHPSIDGQIRVVDIKTLQRIY